MAAVELTALGMIGGAFPIAQAQPATQPAGQVPTVQPRAITPKPPMRTPKPAPAMEEVVPAAAESDAPVLEMFAGETRVLPSTNVARLAVGNGRVMAASVLDDREILIIANDAGTSSLHIWTRDGHSRRMDVNVRPASQSHTTLEILSFLGTLKNVRGRPVADKILVEGDNLSDETLFKLEELAKRYPQVVNFTARVGWEKMILIDVKVVEFKKEKLRNLGIRWGESTGGPKLGVAGDVITNSVYRINPTSADNVVGFENFNGTISPFQWYYGIWSVLSSRLNVYERNGDAVILAAPQLPARSGSSATFQSGGEIPYAVIGRNGDVTVQFKKYGIIIEIKPRADSTGTIRSEITAEVSEPDSSLTNTAVNVPGLRTRKATTEFNVRDGETMVLAGLVDRRKGKSVEQIPGLGSIPILGYLFKSKSFNDNETELVVFVTPRIVDANNPELTKLREDVGDRTKGVLQDDPTATPVAPGERSDIYFGK